MSEVRQKLAAEGVTDREEQDVRLWIMAKRLMDQLRDVFEALDEPVPTEDT